MRSSPTLNGYVLAYEIGRRLLAELVFSKYFLLDIPYQ